MSVIDSKDLSIVVQGKNIPEQTELCLKSLRKHFPQAEIIFSTYLRENVKGLVANIIVKSKDPGATSFSPRMCNNINRILTTTKAGLEKAGRKYCLKIRSDLIVDNNKLLNNIGSLFPKREKAFSVFEERVIFYALWSRKYEYIANEYFIPSPFYLSDWLCFGLTSDIKKYFMETPLTEEPKFSRFFLSPKNRLQGFFDSNVTWRFSPEQYFATNFFKKYFPEANMKSLQDVSLKKMEFSHRVMASNIVICGYKECGFYIQKKQYRWISKHINLLKGMWLGGVYRYGDFLKDYKQYCDLEYNIPLYYKLTNNYDIDNEIAKIHKHFRKFTRPFRYLLKWLEQIFAMIYYIIRILTKSGYVFFNALSQK